MVTFERVTNASFGRADAKVYPFFGELVRRRDRLDVRDVLRRKGAAFANIARALRPGGRPALLAWQPVPANDWILEISTSLAAGPEQPTDGPQPFSLSDPDRVRSWLVAGGFGDVQVEGLAEPMWFGITFGSACWLVTAKRANLSAGMPWDSSRRYPSPRLLQHPSRNDLAIGP